MNDGKLNNFYGKAYYYHVCIISRSCDYNAIQKLVKRISSDFPVIALGYGLNPYAHAHLVIRSKRRINYRKYHVSGLYVKFIPIRSQLHFNNVVKYVSNHPETFIYYHDPNSHGGVGMSDGLDEIKQLLETVVRRLDTIENRIDVLDAEMQDVKKQIYEQTETPQRKTLADKVRVESTAPDTTPKPSEPERIEVRTRVATFVFQRSRKGVAVRIRFAGFVKPNSKGEYYLSLNHDEFKALAVQVQNALESFGSSGDNPKSSKSSNVKIEKGFKKALEE